MHPTCGPLWLGTRQRSALTLPTTRLSQTALTAVAQHRKTVSQHHPSVVKDQSSKFEVRFLLNTDWFHVIIKLNVQQQKSGSHLCQKSGCRLIDTAQRSSRTHREKSNSFLCEFSVHIAQPVSHILLIKYAILNQAGKALISSPKIYVKKNSCILRYLIPQITKSMHSFSREGKGIGYI